jgi:mRNA interferase HigB
MRVIKRLPLTEFGALHPRAVTPLDDWFRLAEKSVWKNFADVRRTFGQTDVARVNSGNTVCVFDIGGNKFRLIAKVSYEKEKIYVLRVLTHREYDTDRWKVEL